MFEWMSSRCCETQADKYKTLHSKLGPLCCVSWGRGQKSECCLVDKTYITRVSGQPIVSTLPVLIVAQEHEKSVNISGVANICKNFDRKVLVFGIHSAFYDDHMIQSSKSWYLPICTIREILLLKKPCSRKELCKKSPSKVSWPQTKLM